MGIKYRFNLFLQLLLIFSIIAGCDKQLSVSPPDPNPGTGKIFLSTNPPDYMIYLNGRITGKNTPDSITFLDAGQYNIELKHVTYLDSQFVVPLSDGEDKSIEINFFDQDKFYSTIDCSTTPQGAEIILDDSSTSVYTPAKLRRIIPGKHKVKFNKTGYRSKEYKFSLKSNYGTTLNVTLEDTTIWLVYDKSNSQLVSDVITSIDVNHSYVWIGTADMGVMDISGNVWENYHVNNSEIPGNLITSIALTNEGNALIGINSGLAYFRDGSIIRTTYQNGGPGPDGITKIVYRPFNLNFCVATRDSGILIFDGHKLTDFAANKNLPSKKISSLSILENYGRSVYAIGTEDAGLIIKSEINGVPEQYINMTNGLASNYISAVGIVAGVYNYYIGVRISIGMGSSIGMLYLKNSDGQLQEINLDNALINDIVVNFSNIWVATNNGLYLIKNQTEVVEKFTSANSPLKSNIIYDLDIDLYGNLWMATGKGVVRYKIQ